MSKLRTLLVFIPLVSIYTIVCGTLSLLLALVFRSGDPSHIVARIWAWLILKTCGIQVLVDGLEHIDKGRIYVFASNHQSLFDIPILFAHLPISFRILFKRSLLRIPFLGWHLWLCGHIPVERENPLRARQSLERAAAHIRAKSSIVVFPEGTRSRDGAIGRFKNGSFLLAIRAGVPVVPVTISESWRVMKRGEFTVHPGRVRVHVDRPIPVDAYKEPSAAAAEVSQRVRGVVVENYRAPGPESLAREPREGEKRAEMGR
jgi:1-acyl-sn-glycerol-3-phosphate acyltransferase